METGVGTVRLVYDRGTILVHPPPTWDIRIRGLPATVWDPRVRVYRAPAYRYCEVREELLRREVPFTEQVRPDDPPPATWRPVDLREYQEHALISWRLAHHRGLVVLPTGSGKTRLALAAMARTGYRTLCLVPTRVLLHQWRSEISRVYPGEVGCYGDGAHDLSPITVVTFESAYRHMPRLGNRFELLVVDEAHHFGGGIRDEALELSIAEARLGLTATPPAEEGRARTLEKVIGPAVFELEIGDLSGTYLAEFELVVLHLELTTEERRSYQADMKAFQDISKRFRDLVPGGTWAQLVKFASGSEEGREALAAGRRARKMLSFTRAKAEAVSSLLTRHRSSRVLVFTADNETAYQIARKHLLMPLTCDIRRKERDDVLSRFREGRLRALVSSRVLNEGLDVPDADVAIVVGGAMGEREHVQRVGRILRPSPGKRALVYELVMRGTMEVWQGQKRRAGLDPRSAPPL